MEKVMFFGGNIITMEHQEYKCDCLLIENGIIKKVGSLEEIEKSINEYVKRIDLQGKTLMPAFIDAHSHITAYAKTLSYVSLNDCKNINDIVEKLKKYKEENKIERGKWIVGVGYDNNFLEEKRHPRKEQLDILENDNTILITHI